MDRCHKAGGSHRRAVAKTGMPLNGLLKRFGLINLDRLVKSTQTESGAGPSLGLVKKRFRTSEKGSGQQPVKP